MKRLCCDRDVAGCNYLQSVLEASNIPCLVKNENVASLFGGQGMPMGNAWPEVWVINDEQFDEAWEILNSMPEPDAPTDEEAEEDVSDE